MSVSYEGSSFPGGSCGWSFFDLFTRAQSDDITKRLVSLLSDRGGFDVLPANSVSDLRGLHLGLPPTDYLQPNLDLIQCHALFSKNADMVTEIDPKEVAIRSFFQSEESCKIINDSMIEGGWGCDASRAVLSYAADYISGVLGNCPSSLSEIEFRFGPGANVSRRGVKYHSPNVKLSGVLTFSNSLIPLLDEVRDNLPRCALAGPVCGILEFVPKSYKTLRSIMIEPGVNSGFQLGVGGILRDRLLRKAKIDLTDQSIQRERARIGSVEDSWSTIDLSRASDSISYMLVMNLLPYPWFCLLDSLRTPLVSHQGKTVVLEKFSSMGNGFTFELETLIFKALIHGIAAYYGVDDDSSVYGDDITCSKALGQHVLDLFPAFGFAVNEDKSFTSGPFREACGGDYHLGVDVRPWYLRSNRDGGRWSAQKLFSFHNFLQRKPWFDPDQMIRTVLLSYLPEAIRLWGPDGFGDGHLVSLADPRTYCRALKKRFAFEEGLTFKTYSAREYAIPQESHYNLPSYVACAGLSLEDIYDFTVVRQPRDSRILSRTATVRWVPTRLDDVISASDWIVHGAAVFSRRRGGAGGRRSTVAGFRLVDKLEREIS